MKFEILDKDGKVENRIIAEPAFMERYNLGQYRQLPEPKAQAPAEPVKTLDEKIDYVLLELAIIKNQTEKMGV